MGLARFVRSNRGSLAVGAASTVWETRGRSRPPNYQHGTACNANPKTPNADTTQPRTSLPLLLTFSFMLEGYDTDSTQISSPPDADHLPPIRRPSSDYSIYATSFLPYASYYPPYIYEHKPCRAGGNYCTPTDITLLPRCRSP